MVWVVEFFENVMVYFEMFEILKEDVVISIVEVKDVILVRGFMKFEVYEELCVIVGCLEICEFCIGDWGGGSCGYEG